MPTATQTQQVTLTLTTDLVLYMQSRIATGEFANESEVLNSLIVQSILPVQSEADLEHWIATEGVRRYDAMRADPSRGLTPEQVDADLASDWDETEEGD